LLGTCFIGAAERGAPVTHGAWRIALTHRRWRAVRRR
jgi:hypothetical protein